jgi:hypothetical protein
MATIRREDKEIIQNLSLLGMLFGAVVGCFLILHFNKQAHLQLDDQAAAAQTHSSLVRLSSNLTEQEASLAEAAIGQVGAAIEPAPEAMTLEKSFWVTLSPWGMWSICAGGALVGGSFGYLTLWGGSWLGSLLTYWMIRIIYSRIRTIAPACAAARRTLPSEKNLSMFQRDQNRLLPTLIKLFILLAITLSILALVVWQLTAL